MHYGGDTDLDDGDGEEGPSSSHEVGDDTESEMDDSDDMDTGEYGSCWGSSTYSHDQSKEICALPVG